MSLKEFEDKPFENSHASYENSNLDLRPRLEWSTGEVLLASTCRVLGMAGETDQRVDLEKIPQLPEALAAAGSVPENVWSLFLGEGGAYRSPTLSKATLPNLQPLVPALATHGGVLGKVRARWTPGQLVLALVRAGGGDDGYQAQATLLATMLSVDAFKDDAVAEFLQTALVAASRPRTSYAVPPLAKTNPSLWRRRPQGSAARSPGERFVDDMPSMDKLKSVLTRRQWMSMVEAQLRAAAVGHALWLFGANYAVWCWIQDALGGKVAPESAVEAAFWPEGEAASGTLELGRDLTANLKFAIERYIRARIGIDLTLWRMKEAGCEWTEKIGVVSASDKSSAASVVRLLKHVAASAQVLSARFSQSTEEGVTGILDKYSSYVACDVGWPKSTLEFLRYTARQLDVKDPKQRSYDQGYLAVRPVDVGESRSRTMRIQLGPVLLLASVHCVASALNGVPATIEDLRLYLQAYGIAVPSDQLEDGVLARDLETLGLVVDSPDAVGGRLLAPPFPTSTS